jgi:two-component system chemotaxis response regulator CheB
MFTPSDHAARRGAKGAGDGSEPQPLRVLIVDDSAVVRQTLSSIINAQPDMTAIVAADPLIALDKMRHALPDVIVLDLEMPRMDGLTFLRKVMADHPLPVVICSEFVGMGSDHALRALEHGAVDLITKPRVGLRHFVEESALMLVDTIRGAACTRPSLRLRLPLNPQQPAIRPLAGAVAASKSDHIIVIGASTGGTEALRELLSALPADAPGILVVQHMPAHFTGSFAARLDSLCAVEVKEAEAGEAVCRGRVLIAPGDQHMRLVKAGDGFAVELNGGPLVSRHRPSVDVLFRSVAAAAPNRSIGVILTGMGEDGADGMLQMKQRGAITFAQDEATCAVFGMPKAAIRQRAVDHILPLAEIAPALISVFTRQGPMER